MDDDYKDRLLGLLCDIRAQLIQAITIIDNLLKNSPESIKEDLEEINQIFSGILKQIDRICSLKYSGETELSENLFEFFREKIESTIFDDGYIIEQLRNDLKRLKPATALHYLLNFSPSKLGRLGYLGLRKLAKIKREHPEIFEKWLKELGN